MNDLDEFAVRLSEQLHESLDGLPVGDEPWGVAQAGIRRRLVVRRRRLLARVGAGTAVVVGVAAVIYATTSGTPTTQRLTPVQAPLRVVAVVDIGGSSPARIAAGAGSVFAAVWDTGKLLRLDPSSLKPTGSLSVGSARNGPLSVAFGGGSVWVLNFADGRLWRVDPSTLRPTMKVSLGAQPSQVSYGDGSVWVTVCCGSTANASRQRLLRIDPGTGEITGSVVVPGDGETVNLAVGPQILVASADAPVVVVDPSTMRTLRRLDVACDGCQGASGLAVGDGGLFATSFSSVLRFEASTGRFDAESPQIGVADTATPLAVAPDGLWLTTGTKLVRLSVTDLAVTETASLSSVAQVVVAEPALYASVGGRVLRLARIRPGDRSAAQTAMRLCRSAIRGSIATAALTTVGDVRTTNIGGVYPGFVPGRHAFPGHSAFETAAWCWVRTPGASASPGDRGSSWDLYAAVKGESSARLFTLGGVSRAPTGPPEIP